MIFSLVSLWQILTTFFDPYRVFSFLFYHFSFVLSCNSVVHFVWVWFLFFSDYKCFFSSTPKNLHWLTNNCRHVKCSKSKLLLEDKQLSCFPNIVVVESKLMYTKQTLKDIRNAPFNSQSNDSFFFSPNSQFIRFSMLFLALCTACQILLCKSMLSQ